MANNNNKIDLYENLPTGCCDEEGHELINGDRVRFLGFEGVVTFECGAFGIAFPTESPINWDTFTEAMRSTNLDPGARPHACCNDHFVSLWEIAWNMDAEECILPGVWRIGSPAEHEKGEATA